MPPRAQEPRAKRPQEAPPEALRHPERSKKPLGPGTAKNQEPRGPGRKPSEEDPSATSKGARAAAGRGPARAGATKRGRPAQASLPSSWKRCGSAGVPCAMGSPGPRVDQILEGPLRTAFDEAMAHGRRRGGPRRSRAPEGGGVPGRPAVHRRTTTGRRVRRPREGRDGSCRERL